MLLRQVVFEKGGNINQCQQVEWIPSTLSPSWVPPVMCFLFSSSPETLVQVILITWYHRKAVRGWKGWARLWRPSHGGAEGGVPETCSMTPAMASSFTQATCPSPCFLTLPSPGPPALRPESPQCSCLGSWQFPSVGLCDTFLSALSGPAWVRVVGDRHTAFAIRSAANVKSQMGVPVLSSSTLYG